RPERRADPIQLLVPPAVAWLRGRGGRADRCPRDHEPSASAPRLPSVAPAPLVLVRRLAPRTPARLRDRERRSHAVVPLGPGALRLRRLAGIGLLAAVLRLA